MSSAQPPISPDSFSPLPELSKILARLRPPAPAGGATAINPLNPLASPGAPGTSQPTPTHSTAAATPLPSDGGVSGGPSDKGPLSLRQIPAATDPIKHRLARARQQVRTLPDAGRTVAQQEAEMEELTRRIEEQKEVLRALREVGIRFGVDGLGEGEQEGRKEGGRGEEMDVVMQ